MPKFDAEKHALESLLLTYRLPFPEVISITEDELYYKWLGTAVLCYEDIEDDPDGPGWGYCIYDGEQFQSGNDEFKPPHIPDDLYKALKNHVDRS